MFREENVLGNPPRPSWRLEHPALVDVRIEGNELRAACSVDTASRDPFEDYFDRQRKPKGQRPPHLVFAGMHETPSDYSELVRLLETYGWLIGRRKRPDLYEAIDDAEDPRGVWGKFRMPLKELRREQAWFAALVKMSSLLQAQKRSSHALCKLMAEAAVLNPKVGEWWFAFEDYHLSNKKDYELLSKEFGYIPRLWDSAEHFFADMLNETLQESSFRIAAPAFDDGYRLLSTADDLLTSFYVMLALDATHNVEIAYCADPRCLRPFVRDRRDQIYCQRTCAVRVAVREHYHRKKARRFRSERSKTK